MFYHLHPAIPGYTSSRNILQPQLPSSNLRHPLRNRSNFPFRRFHPPPQDNNKFGLEDKVSKMEMGGRVILITVGKGGRRGTKWHGRF